MDMELCKPRDSMCSTLYNNLKAAYNVFTGSMHKLLYIF